MVEGRGFFPHVLIYLECQKNTLSESEHILTLICAALGMLCWSLRKLDVVSVFFNLRIVSKSPAEISMPIGAVLELRSHANLPRLVNLAPRALQTDSWAKVKNVISQNAIIGLFIYLFFLVLQRRTIRFLLSIPF